MWGKLSIALLIAASPALAQDAPPAIAQDVPPVMAQETAPAEPAEGEAATGPKSLPYKMKKVCRAQEVVGSSIPRMICSSKRIYLKPGEETEAGAKSGG